MTDVTDGTWLTPTEHEDGPWRLLLLWQVVDGRPECVGATVLSAQPPTAEPGVPLTGATLRDLKLPERIAADRAAMTQPATGAAERAHQAGLRRSTVERFEEVARVYRDAIARGERPVQAVAAKFGLKPTSASNLVMRVRAAGFLPPASPGVPVG